MWSPHKLLEAGDLAAGIMVQLDVGAEVAALEGDKAVGGRRRGGQAREQGGDK